MSEPRVFKRGALRRSGSACAAASATQLLSGTPCAAADGAAFSSRRAPSPRTADAARSGEEVVGPSPQKRHRPSVSERATAAHCAEADPFAFEGSEAAAAAAHAPRIAGRSALLRSAHHARGQVRCIVACCVARRARGLRRLTPRRATAQGDAKRVTWGEPTIHAAPARETPPRSAAFDAEPAGGGGWAPASHGRPLSIARDSGVQLAGALRHTASASRRAVRDVAAVARERGCADARVFATRSCG
jgi:hypothetical protein